VRVFDVQHIKGLNFEAVFFAAFDWEAQRAVRRTTINLQAAFYLA